jgi:nucleoside-diphosphate-sugar epimerase
VLITGASGFLGRHVIEVLRRRRPELRLLALVRDTAAWHALGVATAGIDTLAGSLEAPQAWRDAPALDGLGGILHLGARVEHRRTHAAALERTNVGATRALVELAAVQRCRMVFISTSGTVGCFTEPAAEAHEGDAFCEERVKSWPYYASKIRAEREARAIAEERGVELVVLRPPVLLGPGDHRFRSTGHVLRLLEGRLPFLVRGGIHFVDVRDVAQATVRALERTAVRPIYHLPGTACTTEAFYALVAELASVRGPRFHLPFSLAWSAAHAGALLADRLHFEGLRWLPDPVLVEMASHYWGLASHYAGPELDFSPRDPRETLADTIAWLREHHPALAARDHGTAVQEPHTESEPPAP